MRKNNWPGILTVLLLFGLTILMNSCNEENENDPSTQVTDIDGNIYHTVTIGSQEWMVENLKVTKYRNGDSIQQITVNTEWITRTSGAFRNLDDLASNATVYGRLYNWYAVNDPRNIAPVGWRVANDADWTTLSAFLGNDEFAGGKLKETGTTHWSDPNFMATNEYGFTALPGGAFIAEGTGQFDSGGDYGYWWTSTGSDNERAWSRTMGYNNAEIEVWEDLKSMGYAVRCIRE